MNTRLPWLVIGGLVLAGLVGVGIWVAGDDAPPDERRDAGGPVDASIDAPDAAPSQSADGGWQAPEPGDRVLQAIHEGEPIEARFFVGAPGAYPPMEATGEQVTLPAPASTIGGETVEHYEVYAAAPASGPAFWGAVEPDTDVVELVDAGDVHVQLQGTPGVEIAASVVRLSRSPLALVVRNAQSEGGQTTFEQVPPGEYWISVEAPGWLREVRPIEVDGEGGDFTVQLRRGQRIAGSVTDGGGEPVAGGLVSVFVATDGGPFGGVPDAIVQTDRQGRYSADGVRPGETRAIAVADGYAPTASLTVDTSGGERASYTLDIALERAVNVVATVVDSEGDPVSGARVGWEDSRSGTGGAALSDAHGKARLSSVPTGATVRATIGRWESPHTEVPGGMPTAQVKLRVQLPGDLGPWRMRLDAPRDSTVEGLVVTDDEGARCVISPMDDPRDYVLRGCGEGEAHVRAMTDVGAVRREVPFRDGMTVSIGDPVPVKVRVEGIEDEAWSLTTFILRSPDGRTITPAVEAVSRSERVATADLYPGLWRLTVHNSRVGPQRFDVGVGADGATMTVRLVGFERHRFVITDRFGAAVTGAYAMLFDERGQLVDVSRSAGQLPTEFRIKPPFDGTLLVVDPRRGEGRAPVKGKGGEEPVRVELDQPVLTHRIPATRPDREELEGVLGVSLARGDEGWLVDPKRVDAPGVEAGLQRADRIVTAWREGQGFRVIVYRKSSGYLDLRVP